MTDIKGFSKSPQTPVTSVSKATVSKVNTSSEAVNQASEEASAQSVNSKITRWFAQAGVMNPNDQEFQRDIGKKAERRRIIKQQRKLQNLEKVLEKALEFCPDSGTPDNIDADWFFSFVDMAENIYSLTMQEIWGKIFAVEISNPGTFSIRTLRTLKELTQRDATIFQVAVGLAARKKGEYSPKILYGYYQKPSFISFLNLNKSQQLNLAEFGLAYPDMLSLMDAGLVYNSEIESGELSPSSRTEWRIGASAFHLAPKRGSLFLNYYKFTPTGAELSKLVTSDGSDTYIEKLKAMLSADFEVV